MIISKLTGGLGNQLFQYAVGRSIAARRNVELKLDCSSFRSDRQRKYDLHNLRITAKLATRAEVAYCDPNQAVRPVRLLRKLHVLKTPPARIFKESGYKFEPEVFDIPLPQALSGYWHAHLYFDDIRDILLEEFRPINEPSGKNKEMLEQIKQTESVFLHVRRGDYVNDPVVVALVNNCSLDYYSDAVDLIASRVDSPHLYIFSDDSEWTMQNLHFDLPTTYVTHNDGVTSYEDIRLMSACKHAIIANSTFSWWGAWLMQNEKSIVVAPIKWLYNTTLSLEDKLPEQWIRM